MRKRLDHRKTDDDLAQGGIFLGRAGEGFALVRGEGEDVGRFIAAAIEPVEIANRVGICNHDLRRYSQGDTLCPKHVPGDTPELGSRDAPPTAGEKTNGHGMRRHLAILGRVAVNSLLPLAETLGACGRTL
jgi:hypothetical protein